jgi:hypothetical protein
MLAMRLCPAGPAEQPLCGAATVVSFSAVKARGQGEIQRVKPPRAAAAAVAATRT